MVIFNGNVLTPWALGSCGVTEMRYKTSVGEDHLNASDNSLRTLGACLIKQ
jgi:hypothetical protein